MAPRRVGLADLAGGASRELSAQALQKLFDEAKRAGRLARALRPTSYNAKVVHLVTLLQNLGRLITACAFPRNCSRSAG